MDEFIGIGQIEKRDPQAHPTDPRALVRSHSNGLTLRAHFAGLAMQGLIAAGDTEAVAYKALEYSDALIAELSK